VLLKLKFSSYPYLFAKKMRHYIPVQNSADERLTLRNELWVELCICKRFLQGHGLKWKFLGPNFARCAYCGTDFASEISCPISQVSVHCRVSRSPGGVSHFASCKWHKLTFGGFARQRPLPLLVIGPALPASSRKQINDQTRIPRLWRECCRICIL